MIFATSVWRRFRSSRLFRIISPIVVGFSGYPLTFLKCVSWGQRIPRNVTQQKGNASMPVRLPRGSEKAVPLLAAAGGKISRANLRPAARSDRSARRGACRRIRRTPQHRTRRAQRCNPRARRACGRFGEGKVRINARMGSQQVRKFCALSNDAGNLLGMAMDSLNLSARAHDRILKVARTFSLAM